MPDFDRELEERLVRYAAIDCPYRKLNPDVVMMEPSEQ